jgi:hypothetical protein
MKKKSKLKKEPKKRLKLTYQSFNSGHKTEITL